MPWYSSYGSDFNYDFQVTLDTYSAYGRGNEYTPSFYTLLDLTALGRQEAWEEPRGRAPAVHAT